MGEDFHESFTRGEIKAPSERATGLTFSVAAVVVAVWWRNSPTVPLVALSVAALLVVLSVIAPSILTPLNLMWFRIGTLLHAIVNPLVMLAMFALVFLPAGLIMRIWHDPLRSRRAAPEATYWIKRSTGTHSEGSMKNQF